MFTLLSEMAGCHNAREVDEDCLSHLEGQISVPHAATMVLAFYPTVFLGMCALAALFMSDALTVVHSVSRMAAGAVLMCEFIVEKSIGLSERALAELIGMTVWMAQATMALVLGQWTLEAVGPTVTEAYLQTTSVMQANITAVRIVADAMWARMMVVIDDKLFEGMYVAQEAFEMYASIFRVQKQVLGEVPRMSSELIHPWMDFLQTRMAEMDAKEVVSALIVLTSGSYTLALVSSMVYSYMSSSSTTASVDSAKSTVVPEAIPHTPSVERTSAADQTTFLTPATSFGDALSSEPEEEDEEEVNETPSGGEVIQLQTTAEKSLSGDPVKEVETSTVDDTTVKEVVLKALENVDASDRPQSCSVSPAKPVKTRLSTLRSKTAVTTPQTVIDLSESTLIAEDDDVEADENLVRTSIWTTEAPSSSSSAMPSVGRVLKMTKLREILDEESDQMEAMETKENTLRSKAEHLSGRIAVEEPPRRQRKATTKVEELSIGQKVTVCNPVRPGVPYKPGGVAQITAINMVARTVDVKYLVENGRERNVPESNVIPGIHPEMYGMMSSAVAGPKSSSSAVVRTRGVLEDKSNHTRGSAAQPLTLVPVKQMRRRSLDAAS